MIKTKTVSDYFFPPFDYWMCKKSAFTLLLRPFNYSQVLFKKEPSPANAEHLVQMVQAFKLGKC